MCVMVAGRRLTKLTSASESSGSRWLRASARFTFKLYCWPTRRTSRIEDYFYRPLCEGESRSTDAQEFFAKMMKLAGIAPDVAANEEAALAEFQRRGFYLAHAVECPVATPGELNERITRASSTLLKRIEFSYRPKHVVPIGPAVKALIPVFQKSSISDRLDVPT